jgi:dipeptidyl aminopeptidase/acylaminoacyl peptidase
MHESSPINNIGRLAVPVLLMHRRDDERIPFAQGRRMHQALQRAGKSVDWLELPKNREPDAIDRAQLQIYQKLVSFLDTHLTG